MKVYSNAIYARTLLACFFSTFLIGSNAQTCPVSDSSYILTVGVSGKGSVLSSPAGIQCGSGSCAAAFSASTPITLTASPNAGAAFVGWIGNCYGIGNTTTIDSRTNTNCTATFEAAGNYKVLYVSTTGNDATGNGSASSPWKTISFSVSKMVGGDTLVVKSGTYPASYSGGVTSLSNFIPSPPSGTALRMTRVVAEKPMEVRIQSSTPLNYYDAQLKINGNYVLVDGFIFDMSGTNSPPHIAAVEGSFNKVTRSIFKRSGDIDKYGGLLYNGGNDNLFEDIAGSGACRYCFEQGGPTSSIQRNIWRRAVGRFDYSNSQQPKATFATYGNDNNLNVRDHLYQNVIALDGQNPGTLGGPEEKYGAFYTPKNTANVRLQGSIVLREGVGNAGIFIQEFSSVNSATDTVVWDLLNSNSYAPGLKAASGSSLTIGGTIPAQATAGFNSPATSSLLKPATKPTSLINNAPGATIMRRYGGTGTRWGDPGYDQLSNEDLWPWPFQDKIKAVFSEANSVPSGSSPSTNVTKRGFAADGNGLYGGPISLTSYIWEYLGTSCPKLVCP